ncbi:hypothetical protein AB3N60_07100 [Leptospira sp. WS39.C2]
MVNSNSVLPMTTNYKEKLILFGTILLVLSLQVLVQLSSEFAYGADGYYYAAQVNSYVTKGRFFSPDASPILYGLVYFSKLGNDIVITNKIFVSLLVVSLFFVSFRFAFLLSKKFYVSLFFGLFLISSSYLPHFSFNFIKNLGGILFLILLLTEIYNLEKNNFDRKLLQYVKIFLFFGLVFFSHKITAGIALCFLLLWLGKHSHSFKYKTITVIFGVISLVTVVSVFFPNTLQWNDLQTTFSENLQFDFQIPFYQYSKLYPEFIWEQIVFFLSPLIYLITRRKLTKDQKSFYDQFLVLFVLLTLPFFTYTAFNFPFRMFLLVFIPGTFLLLPFFSQIKSAIILVILCVLLFPYQYFTMIRGKDFNNQDYKLYSIILPLFQFPKNTLIIVHQGFDYFICYHKAGDAFHFLPEEKHKNRPIYRIVFGVSSLEFKKYLGESTKIQYLPGFYSILEENKWQEFLSLLPADRKEQILDWRNPNTHRTKTMLINESFKEITK